MREGLTGPSHAASRMIAGQPGVSAYVMLSA
jgi:hypothetical protein